MKLPLIILSLTIAALVAACAEGDSRTLLTTHSSGSTLAQLEKASSDDELKKFKAQLEQNNTQDVAAVIQAVKRKFKGKSSSKEMPSRKQRRMQQKERAEEDIQLSIETTEKPTNSEFLGKRLYLDADPKLVKTTRLDLEKDKDTYVESKHICVHDCNLQVLVERKFVKKKITSVNAFVITALDKENLSLGEGSKNSIKSLDASYEVSSNTMKIVITMDLDKKESYFKVDNYKYSDTTLPQANFKLKQKDGSGPGVDGVFEVTKDEDGKYISLKTKNKDDINILIIDDLGLFKIKSEAKDGQINTQEQKDVFGL